MSQIVPGTPIFLNAFAGFPASGLPAFDLRADPGAAWLTIDNNSPFILKIFFGHGPPTAENDPKWHATVGPGGHPTIPITGSVIADFRRNPLESLTNPWEGRIRITAYVQPPRYIMPDYTSSWIGLTTWSPGEQRPETWGSVFPDSVNQPRVITIPLVPNQALTGTIAAPAADSVTTVVTYTPGPALNPVTGTNSFAYFIYDAQFFPYTAAAVSGKVVRIEVDNTTGAGVSRGAPYPVPLWTTTLTSGPATPVQASSNWHCPRVILIPVDLTYTDIRVYIHALASAAALTFEYNLMESLDTRNFSATPGGIGASTIGGGFAF